MWLSNSGGSTGVGGAFRLLHGPTRTCGQAGPAAALLENLLSVSDAATAGLSREIGDDCPKEPHIYCFTPNAEPGSAFHQAALDQGVAICGSFPIFCGGLRLGVLNLYADESNAFADREIEVLKAVALDISHALEHFQSLEEQRRAEHRFAGQGHVARVLNGERIASGVLTRLG